MAEWKRDPAQIDALSLEFQGLSQILSQLSQNLGGYSDALGASNVTQAFNAIANNWWVERGKLVTELQSASSALVEVAKSYTEDESAISKSS